MTSYSIGSAGCGPLHQLLLEAGYQVDLAELKSGIFGLSTRQAVLSFQAHHVDLAGKPLDVDGLVGPATFAALQNPRAPGVPLAVPGWRCDETRLRDAVKPVVRAALGELALNVREVPDASNRGPRVDAYGGRGQPWCAFFLSWCFGRTVGGSPFGVLGSAYKMREWGEKNGRLLGVGAIAQPGDIGIILRAPDKNGEIHGHVFLVVHNHLPERKLSTVEGNAGNAVRGLLRDPLSISAFVRPIPL